MTAVTLSREELLALADRMDDHSAAAKAASRNPPIDTTRSGWLQASQDFADSAAALRLAAKPADEGREALRGLLAWTGATRAGINDPEERAAFEDDLKIARKVRDDLDRALSTTGEPKR